MDYIALSRISLKHLTVLHMLLTTHSVTLAAERLCVTPSSVSKTLGQLRETLKDDLFYRDGTRLVPTAFALHIGPSIHGILSSMNGLLHQGSFNPAYYQGSFSLAMRESSFELFAPVLQHLSQQLGNHAHLNVHAKEEMSFDALVRGQVDFLLLPHDLSQPPTQNKDLVWQTILKDEMVCLMGPSNPLSKQPLSVESYLCARHIGIHDKDLSQPYFEQNLTQRHSKRNMAMRVADFGSAAVMCQHSDYLFTCSKLWARTAMQAKGLVEQSLPFDYGQVAYSLVWNKASLNDPAIKWLQKQLLDACTMLDACDA
ncbi:LysR family transcriptional regulator [Vibrio diabolicus]|uniref:LysR family transcriptional regulator n=1 Tax=Vibrio diabolicus TaxID=50719 RepID=UPI00080F52AC|nr:LysR family transcriptional regulator [Vibrio diabolicus]MCS0364817.1 LysR family transcriptional regulator [Vibrio diabolicus]MCS0444936.1 LysR family transcriptional regulator [Vibrio diabolicus]OCH65118.1 LysR family transcriptional regulator [Vibrio diabolicus]